MDLGLKKYWHGDYENNSQKDEYLKSKIPLQT